MRVEQVRLNMMQDITLTDINDESQSQAEKTYLEDTKKKLQETQEALKKEVSKMIGELTFYYFEINRIDERLEELG